MYFDWDRGAGAVHKRFSEISIRTGERPFRDQKVFCSHDTSLIKESVFGEARRRTGEK